MCQFILGLPTINCETFCCCESETFVRVHSYYNLMADIREYSKTLTWHGLPDYDFIFRWDDIFKCSYEPSKKNYFKLVNSITTLQRKFRKKRKIYYEGELSKNTNLPDELIKLVCDFI